MYRLPLRSLGSAVVLVVAVVFVGGCGKKGTDPDEPAGGGGGGGGDSTGGSGDIPTAPRLGGPVSTTWDIGETNRGKRDTNDNLRQIGMALHSFHDAYTALPVGYYDKSGKKLGLSWRVAILPYVEQNALFKEFKLDEPWDSDHNKKLIRKMPKVYAINMTGVPAGYTFYRGFGKAGALGSIAPVLPPGQPGQVARASTLPGITDGTSNTLMVAEVAEPTIWTRPDDPEVDDKSPLPKMGGVFKDGFNGLMCDGSVRWFKTPLPETTLRHLIMRADGNVINIPWAPYGRAASAAATSAASRAFDTISARFAASVFPSVSSASRFSRNGVTAGPDTPATCASRSARASAAANSCGSTATSAGHGWASTAPRPPIRTWAANRSAASAADPTRADTGRRPPRT